MENKHPYSKWENRKPKCEEFGFSEKDIPKIREAEEQFRNISSFIPSDELQALRKRREEIKLSKNKINVKRKDVNKLGPVLSFIVTVGLVLAVLTGGYKDFSMGLIDIVCFLILISIPVGLFLYTWIYLILDRLVISPLDSLVNKNYNDAVRRMTDQDKQRANQIKEIDEQIIDLEIEEEERHRKYIQGAFGNAYSLSGNLKSYYSALDYYNKCRDSRSSEYWDRFQGGNGNDFEKACAKFLGNKGFLTRVTPIGPDQGIDIYASRDGLEYACQCKALGSKVSSGDIQRFIGVLVTGSYAGGFFFSLNGFSENAIQVAKTSPKIIYCLSKKELMKGVIR